MSTTDRIPPQSIEAEQALLGAMLLSKEAVDAGSTILMADDFYGPGHRHIFKAIVELYNKSITADVVSVCQYLKDHNQIDDCGGREYVTGLLEAYPSVANAEHYSNIILSTAIKKDLELTANNIMSYVYDQTKTAQDILEMAESDLYKTSMRKSASSYTDSLTGAQEGLQFIERLKKSGMLGIPTGYNSLNYMTKGFQGGDLILIGGRPSVGKSAFARNTIERTIFQDHQPRLVFSLEVSKDRYFANMISALAHTDLYAELKDEDWTRLSTAAGKIANETIYINDETDITPQRIKSIARLLKQRHNIASVYIDYLQLVNPGIKTESRNLDVGSISRNLKITAKDLNIPIIALSQLSRAGDERPQLKHLRDSGSLEQDADGVIFIHRNREKDQYVPDSEIIVAKYRNGITGNFELTFKGEHISFEEPEFKHKDDQQYYQGGQ